MHEKEGTLANSNQRARKGFEPTLHAETRLRRIGGPLQTGLVLYQTIISEPRGEGHEYEFAPHFPMTMRDLNNAVPDCISDHAPITVDLPLAAPAKPLHTPAS